MGQTDRGTNILFQSLRNRKKKEVRKIEQEDLCKVGDFYLFIKLENKLKEKYFKGLTKKDIKAIIIHQDSVELKEKNNWSKRSLVKGD